MATGLAAMASSSCSDGSSDAVVTHRSALPVLEALGCTQSAAVETPDEPVAPNSARECVLGESHFAVRTYDGFDDRDRVLEYLHQFSGYRVVGNAWIIAVDTPEAARKAAEQTSGTVVELRGTT